MIEQLIPFCAIFLLFLVNIARKKKLVCLSSILLGFELIGLAVSLYFSYEPRVGVPFVSTNAMLFLAINLVLLFLPLIFLPDGHITERHVCIDDGTFHKVSVGLLIVLLPVSLFFLCRAIPELHKFFAIGGDRSAFRDGMDSSVVDHPIVAVSWIFGSFFYCGLFWGVVGLFFAPQRRVENLLLLFSGSLWMFDGIRSASRSNIFYSVLFCLAVVLSIKMFCPKCKFHIPKLIYLAMFCIVSVFGAITICRFGSNSTEEKGIGYNLLAYFASGPYCFNADYALRATGETDSLCGFLTCGLPLRLVDKIRGTSWYTDRALLHEEYYEPNAVIHKSYADLSGTFSGEFKTTVGTFLLDFSPSVVLLIFTFFAIMLSTIFSNFKPDRMSDVLLVSTYVYVILTANIGFVFGTFRGNLALVAILFFYFSWKRLEGKEVHQCQKQ